MCFIQWDERVLGSEVHYQIFLAWHSLWLPCAGDWGPAGGRIPAQGGKEGLTKVVVMGLDGGSHTRLSV